MSDENISAIRARLKFKNLDEFGKGYARYISSGGIFIPMSPDRLKPVGVMIRFQFLLQDGSTALLGEGRVHQVRATSQGGKAPVGMLVKFTKLSQTSKKLVDRIVAFKQRALASSQPAQPLAAEASSSIQGLKPPAPPTASAHQEEPQAPSPPPAPPGFPAQAMEEHSSLEEVTRAGPSPTDITPTRHLNPENQPPVSVREADDAPTKNGEQAHISQVNEDDTLERHNPAQGTPEQGGDKEEARPTREVDLDDAPAQEDPFGDFDLGLSTPSIKPPTGDAPRALDSTLQHTADPALEEPRADVADTNVDVEAAIETVEGPDEDDSNTSEAKESEEDAALVEASEEAEEASLLLGEEAREDGEDALVGAVLDALEETSQAADAEQPHASEGEDVEEEVDEDIADAHAEELAQAEANAAPLEDAQEEEEEEAQEDMPSPPAAAPSSIKLPPPPPFGGTLPPPPSAPGAAHEDEVDLGLLFSDDGDSLFDDIMLPGFAAAPSKPLQNAGVQHAPAQGEGDKAPALMPPEPSEDDSVIAEESEALVLDDAIDLSEPSEPPHSVDEPDLFDLDPPDVAQEPDDDPSPTGLEVPEGEGATSQGPTQLAQTAGGLQVLAYDESSAFDESLEALSVVNDAEDIDLMFDGIFGGSGGESEDDIFGDVFGGGAFELAAEGGVEERSADSEEPSIELSSLLDDIESDEDEELKVDVDGLELHGPSFVEEVDAPSEEEEAESLAALLESARQDIDKLHQQREDEEDHRQDDTLLEELLGDEALSQPRPQEPAAAPMPEPKKKERRTGLFSKLFKKD